MTDFQVMSQMAKENKDIRATPHFVSANLAKGGGHIVMGVDAETIQDLIFQDEKYLCVLYIVNKQQFDEIKKTANK